MKNLFMLFLSLLFFSCCSKSQDSTKSGQDLIKNEWTSLIYTHNSGPLPPPHYYEYSISINSDGSANILYKTGYGTGNPDITLPYSVPWEKIVILNEKINSSKLLTDQIEKIPEGQHPIGGSLSSVRIIVVDPDPNKDRPPTMFESPYFPVEKYKQGLNNLYDYITSLVPFSVWEEIEKKKSEFKKE